MKISLSAVATLLIALSVGPRLAGAEVVSRNVALEGEITRIYLTGSAEVHVTQGDESSVTLTTEDSLVEKVQARVRGRSLYLGQRAEMASGFSGTQPVVRFDVQLPRIDAVRVWGSGNAYLGDLVAGRFKVIVYGSGNVETGSIHADSVRFEIGGSGTVDSREIVARETGIEVAGSADLKLGQVITGELEIDIAGSSDVVIKDLQAADIETEVSGSANITIAGKATSQDLEINGSGDYDTPGLESDYVYIEIRGGGNVVVSVEKELTAELARGADLEYYGTPELAVDISGDGKSRRVGDVHRNE